MKKLSVTLLVCTFLLTSCGSAPVAVQTDEAKSPFYVETQKARDFPQTYSVEKTGRLVGSSTISLASQGIGRVQSISVHEGSVIKK